MTLQFVERGIGLTVAQVGMEGSGRDVAPFPVIVTTKSITFLGVGIPINLHFPLLL